jgi:hypothetical protein
MSGSAATAARHKLEDEARAIVWKLAGIPALGAGGGGAEPAAAAEAATAGPRGGRRKRTKDTEDAAGEEAPSKRQRLDVEGRQFACGEIAAPARLDFALRSYIARLPTNHGAQLCLEELFSFLRRMRSDQRPSPAAAAAAPAPAVVDVSKHIVAAEVAADKAIAGGGASGNETNPARVVKVESLQSERSDPSTDSAAAPLAADGKIGKTVAADIKIGNTAAADGKIGKTEIGLVAGPTREELLDAAIGFCQAPPFKCFLSAFGCLPDHPFLLVFDPHSYQNATPGATAAMEALRAACRIKADASILLPTPDLPVVGGSGGGKHPAMRSEHVLDLEKQDELLVLVFNEEHRPTGLRCTACRETRYLNIWTCQTRSADEGSSILMHCLRCNNIDRSR